MTAESILQGLDDCPLHRRTPFGMMNVSMTQMSIARFFGGITYNGDRYVYNAITDELIRSDVQKWITKRERAAKKAAKKADQQTEIFGKDENQLDSPPPIE
jgi:hypothetical protein